MNKIITGFKTKQDVRDVLKWIQNNTEFKWISWEKPTEFTEWEEYFNSYQKDWGFYIEYEDNFQYCSVNYDWEWKEQINFKDLIQEFKRWDIVEVRDGKDKWKERIYIATIEWAIYPYIVVNSNLEDEFKKWEKFDIIRYKQIRPLKKTYTITLEWKDIEISKESFEALKESLIKLK